MDISEAAGGTGSRPILPDGGPAAPTMKSFLNACGLREPLRIVVDGPTGAGPRTLPQPFAVIGRDNRADLILDDERVSRRHVYLQAVVGHVFWLDLETRTGTCDETGTRKSGWLTASGLLEIGPFVIRRAPGPDPALVPSNRPGESPLAVRAFSHEPLPEVSLEFLNGPSQATVWPMNRVMSLIGSAQGCKFRLTDPSVSPFHASLLRTAEGLWVVDLRGGRSITVNGEPVRFQPLTNGDVLGIGRYRIQIRCRESREGAAGLPARRAAGDLARRSAALTPALTGSSPAFAGPLLPMPAMPMPPAPMPGVASATGVEMVPSDAAPGRFHPEVSESVLVPLVNQFSMMQQQMFDQFQQAMGMLLQMFGTMHREQMDVIREELDRLHDLTRELQELKEELARNPRGAPPSPATAPASSPAARPAAPALEIPIPPPRPAAPSSPPRPAQSAAAAAPETIAARSASPASPTPRPAAATTSPEAPRPDQPAPGQTGPGVQGPAPGQDTVAWIHQRIMTIQRERETRWQKILKLLPGVS